MTTTQNPTASVRWTRIANPVDTYGDFGRRVRAPGQYAIVDDSQDRIMVWVSKEPEGWMIRHTVETGRVSYRRTLREAKSAAFDLYQDVLDGR